MKPLWKLIIILLLFAFSCTKDKGNDSINDGTLHYVDVGTDKIAFRTYGQGMPLLMCMGYSGAMDMWHPQVIGRISQYYKVIIFDYPGVGYSSTYDTSQSIAGLAETTYQFLAAINEDSLNLLGWSMGTNVVLELMVNHPEIINKVVLYAGDCGDTIAIQPEQWVVDIMTADTTPEAFLSILFPPAWFVSHPDPSTYMPHLEETVDSETIDMQWRALNSWFSPNGGVVDKMSSINQEVLLITGDTDVCTPTENSFILKDSLANSTLIILNDCGHGAMYQVPGQFSEYIISFLDNK